MQEVTFVQKKSRRGGQKLLAKVVPALPVTPTSVRSRSTFSTPTQSPRIPALLSNDSPVGTPPIGCTRTTKHGRVCVVSSVSFNLLMCDSVSK